MPYLIVYIHFVFHLGLTLADVQTDIYANLFLTENFPNCRHVTHSLSDSNSGYTTVLTKTTPYHFLTTDFAFNVTEVIKPNFDQ